MTTQPFSWLTEFAQRLRAEGAAAQGNPVAGVRSLIARVPLLLRILLVLTIIPIVEYALLVWVSEQIGFLLTLSLVLATGVVGAWLVRQQGSEAWNSVLNAVRQGQPFGDSLFDVVLIGIAGVFLIAPGLLTDLAGFSLLIPRLRNWIKGKLAEWLRARAMMQVQAFGVRTAETVIDVPPERRSSTDSPTDSVATDMPRETRLDSAE